MFRRIGYLARQQLAKRYFFEGEGARVHTKPIASPTMYTSDWSATAPGEARKKYAIVRWKSDREVIMVAADMRPILN